MLKEASRRRRVKAAALAATAATAAPAAPAAAPVAAAAAPVAATAAPVAVVAQDAGDGSSSSALQAADIPDSGFAWWPDFSREAGDIRDHIERCAAERGISLENMQAASFDTLPSTSEIQQHAIRLALQRGATSKSTSTPSADAAAHEHVIQLAEQQGAPSTSTSTPSVDAGAQWGGNEAEVRDLMGELQKLRDAGDKRMKQLGPPRWTSGASLAEDVFYPITTRQIQRWSSEAGSDLCSFVPELQVDLPFMVGRKVTGPDGQVTLESAPSNKQWAAPLEAVLKYVAGDTGVTLPATSVITNWSWHGDYPEGTWRGKLAKSPLLGEFVQFVSSEAADVRASAGLGFGGSLAGLDGVKAGWALVVHAKKLKVSPAPVTT